MEGLLTAVKALQIAPVETAKAVQVTVEGTASMVGQAFQSCTETVTAATQESMQQLAESTRNAKVLCMHCMSDDSVTSASSFTHDSLTCTHHIALKVLSVRWSGKHEQTGRKQLPTCQR